MRKIMIAGSIALLSLAAPAMAEEDEGCTKAPRAQWLDNDQLKTKLAEQGYTIDKLEIEDDCAEAYVKAKDGKTAKLYLDPATGLPAQHDD